jgi:hypothetical protein
MDVSDARRLKALEDENARLKKLLAEQMLDNAILKDVAAKNVWSAPALQGIWTSVRRSLRKCIRPLASGLLLQSGHDEIRAHRSQIMVRATMSKSTPALRSMSINSLRLRFGMTNRGEARWHRFCGLRCDPFFRFWFDTAHRPSTHR